MQYVNDSILQMRILGISISQFHDKAGFQLVKSVPADTVLTKEQFALYSDLILPREELCDRILAIEFKDDYFLVVKPLLSKNKNNEEIYKREKYIYSVSILVNKSDYLDQIKQPLYKHIVTKVAHFLKIIEETNHIIHYHGKFDQYIENLLTHIFDDINQKGTCDLTYLCNYYSFINVNYPPYIQDRCNILQSSVPVTVLSYHQIERIESEFGRKLLFYAYEGSYCFKKICRLNPDKKQTQIKQFYSKAVQKGLVFILDMLNIHNVYVLTSKVLPFLPQHQSNKHSLLGDIAKAVKKSKNDQVSKQQILCIYLQFNRVSPLSKIIESNRKLIVKIDVYKLVRMGQIYGILKRIHQKIAYTQLPFPLVQPQAQKKYLLESEKVRITITSKYLEEESDKMDELVKKYLSANMTMDQMLVNLQLDYERLMGLLSSQNRYILQINDNQN